MSHKNKKKKKHPGNHTKKSHKKGKKKHSKSKKKDLKKHLADHLDKEDMLDLNKKLYPISFYLSDRAEMLNQMFLSLDWKHLRSMLPPNLKDVPIARIKELALRELLGMSNERIISILNGQQLENSSESDLGNEDVTVVSKTGLTKSSKCIMMNESKMEDDSSESWLYGKKGRSLGNCLKLLGVQDSENSSDMDTLEIGITPKEVGELLEDPPVMKEDGGVGEKKGKTLLEILELEMRARAIRALLKQHDDETPAKADQGGEVKAECLGTSHNKPEVLGLGDQTMTNFIGTKCPTPTTSSGRKSPSAIMQSNLNRRHNLTKTRESIDISVISPKMSLECQPQTTRSLTNLEEKEKMTGIFSSEELKHKYSPKDELQTSEHRTEVSWAARWFHSKDVQKVVSTSRMCAKIRSRMKLAQKFKPSSNTEVSKPDIIGSVKEYKTLVKSRSPNDNAS